MEIPPFPMTALIPSEQKGECPLHVTDCLRGDPSGVGGSEAAAGANTEPLSSLLPPVSLQASLILLRGQELNEAKQIYRQHLK